MSITEIHHPEGNPHEHHHKEITIIVNGRPKKVAEGDLSFSEIVALAFTPVPPNALFTVTYSRGDNNKSGSLQPGQTVKIKDGMIFNVTETGQS